MRRRRDQLATVSKAPRSHPGGWERLGREAVPEKKVEEVFREWLDRTETPGGMEERLLQIETEGIEGFGMTWRWRH